MSDFAARVAGWQLPGTTGPVWPTALANDEFSLELGRIAHHKLIGVAAAAVAAGDLIVVDEQHDLIAAQHEEAMLVALELDQLAVRVSDLLAGKGIRAVVLKGSALAHTVAPMPEQRVFGDVDVLVRSEDIDAAVSALTNRGAKRRLPELRTGFDRRFAKSVSMVWQGREVDLHRTLAPGPFGLSIVEEDLHSTPASFSVGGHRLDTLSPELHLVHACYHAMLGDVRPAYGSLRDIGLLLHRPIEIDEVLAFARRWGGEAVLARGVATAVTTLGCQSTPLTKWADRYRVSRRDQVLMKTYQTTDRRFRRTATASLVALPSWRDRYDFLRSVARPSEEHRAARR